MIKDAKKSLIKLNWLQKKKVIDRVFKKKKFYKKVILLLIGIQKKCNKKNKLHEKQWNIVFWID